MTTIFMVNGEEKTLEIRNANGIDWSADFIGNTYHGMDLDDDGRYIASQGDYEWWQNMIAKWQQMETVIADYKDHNNPDEVQSVVDDTMGGYDLGDQPARVIDALKEAFDV